MCEIEDECMVCEFNNVCALAQPNKNNNGKRNNDGNDGNNRNNKKQRTEDNKQLVNNTLNMNNPSKTVIKPVVDSVEVKCNNPLCDHKDGDNDEVVPVEINTIKDLIELGKMYHCKKRVVYCGLDMKTLFNLIEPLSQLNDMVGMNEVKTNIVNQIVFFLQGFDKRGKCNECSGCLFGKDCSVNSNSEENMHNIILLGAPGCGKTELGRIMGKLYTKIGLLGPNAKGTFKIVKASDLIAKYVGHTRIQTEKVLNECKGGVIFIDEAYSLGDFENRDPFSKECIDTINQFLTENRDILIIIAGYAESINKCIFQVNQGLKRRFPFVYTIKSYNARELRDIFLLKIKKDNWDINVDPDKLKTFFTNRYNYFPNYGGDIENYFLKCKIAHSKRVMYLTKGKKMLTIEDLKEGFKSVKSHTMVKTHDGDYNLDYDGIYTFSSKK
jgi:hypothetical protein